MLKSIAEDITIALLNNKIIDSEDRDSYIYGFEVILSSLIVTGTLLTLGIVLNKILLTLIFILVFISLRSFTGGYHSEKFRNCFTISVTIYLSELMIIGYVDDDMKFLGSVIFFVMSGFIIYRLAPIEHKNNPLSYEEKIKYKKICRAILGFISISTLLGFYIKEQYIDIYFMTSMTVLVIAFLIIISIWKGGEKYD